MDKVSLLGLIKDKLEGTDKFLVDMQISKDNRIKVAIDGDNGITIDDCVELSRYIESHLNRDEEDFELNVSSAGIDTPLKQHRQYVKNIGRQIQVLTTDGATTQGKLTEVSDDQITIVPPSTKRKHKEQVEEDIVTIPFDTIQTAKIVIQF